MAVDTQDKRASCINFCAPFKFAAPVPDGDLTAQADRQLIAFSYSGILATAGGGGGFNVAWTINSTLVFQFSGVYS